MTTARARGDAVGAGVGDADDPVVGAGVGVAVGAVWCVGSGVGVTLGVGAGRTD
jgi:hypothetical protein